VKSKLAVTHMKLGCRVFLSKEVHMVLDTLKKNHSPSLSAIMAGGAAGKWRLEEWVADHLLTCKVGQCFDDSMENDVYMLLERRSGPIGAAIAVSIALPND
jgi:hypothetical protein